MSDEAQRWVVEGGDERSREFIQRWLDSPECTMPSPAELMSQLALTGGVVVPAAGPKRPRRDLQVGHRYTHIATGAEAELTHVLYASGGGGAGDDGADQLQLQLVTRPTEEVAKALHLTLNGPWSAELFRLSRADFLSEWVPFA